MAFTSEELDNYPLCNARKKSGETCRMFAGAGTDHKGIGRCKWHLGNTRNHRHKAAKEQVLQEAQALGLASSVQVTPGQAIQGLLNATAGAYAYLTAMVGGLSQDQMFEEGGMGVVQNRWIRALNDEKDRLARVAKTAADMGVDERQIKIAEAQTEMMGSLLEAVMDHMELSAEQRQKIGPAIRLALAEANPIEGEAVDAEVVEDEPPRTGHRMPARPFP